MSTYLNRRTDPHSLPCDQPGYCLRPGCPREAAFDRDLCAVHLAETAASLPASVLAERIPLRLVAPTLPQGASTVSAGRTIRRDETASDRWKVRLAYAVMLFALLGLTWALTHAPKGFWSGGQ